MNGYDQQSIINDDSNNNLKQIEFCIPENIRQHKKLFVYFLRSSRIE